MTSWGVRPAKEQMLSTRNEVKPCLRETSPAAAAAATAAGLLILLKCGKDVRRKKVKRVRRSVLAATYENDLKLSVAVDRMLEDVTE
jgi:hypothetical protein